VARARVPTHPAIIRNIGVMNVTQVTTEALGD
jgi:hypothetical protein